MKTTFCGTTLSTRSPPSSCGYSHDALHSRDSYPARTRMEHLPTLKPSPTQHLTPYLHLTPCFHLTVMNLRPHDLFILILHLNYFYNESRKIDPWRSLCSSMQAFGSPGRVARVLSTQETRMEQVTLSMTLWSAHTDTLQNTSSMRVLVPSLPRSRTHS